MNFLSYNRNLPFWLITFSVVTVLILSQLIQDGMFMDGMFYTCVGKNLADGLGTFWNPHLSKTFMYSFHVQPPLYFGILAIFYKVFGNSMYVERLFDLVFFSGAAIYIHKIWKKIYSDNSRIASLSWLPVLFWVSIPICFWAYTNHVEEVLMSFFAVASVYHILLALHLKKNVLFNIILAGIFIFLSSLTKGPQGLFPLAAIGLYWLVSKRITFSRAILYTLLLIAVTALIYGCILMNDVAYKSFQNYFDIRMVRAFNGVESTTTNRSEIIVQLFLELLPILLFSGIFLFFSRNKREMAETEDRKPCLLYWMFLIGMSASLPLMVTLEQRNFYLVTSLPYFAIAIAMLIGSRLALLIGKIKLHSKKLALVSLLSSVLLISSIVYTATKAGECKRDKDEIADVYSIGRLVPHGEIVGIPVQMMEDWSTRYYLLRYFYINLDANTGTHFFILRKDLSKDLVPSGYVSAGIQTKYLDLYTK